jgi:hypothetical protein
VSEERPLIDAARLRREHEERARALAEHPERARITKRAVARVVRDYLKEARVGTFTFTSDEHPPAGEGSAPTPLDYFVAAVGL